MPERAPLDPVTARWIPWVVAIAFFMQSLDGTILNTALPAMARSLAEDPLRMQGVIIAYMLTVALLIPASGWIADRFGTKRIFFSAILLFSFGSLLCAAANSLGFLIFARVVQGLGGALMLPVGRLVVLRAYPRTELVRIMSFITIPGLLGPLLGPTVGGWLVEILSWHWIFLLNLPVGLIGCYAVWKFIPDLRGAERTTFDGPGFLLFGAAMVLITIAMEGPGELHLPHLRVMLLLFAGMACWRPTGCVPGATRSHCSRPACFACAPLPSVSSATCSPALAAAPCRSRAVAAAGGAGYSPAQAGMSMIPLAAAAMLAKSIARPLIERFGYRIILTGNTLLLGILLASTGLVDEQTPYWLLLVQLGLLGAVNSMQFTAMNTVTLIDLDDASASSGNSLLSVVAQLALSLGVACAGALLGGFTAAGSAEGVETTLGAFQLTFVTIGVMAMLAAAIFLQLAPTDGRRARRPEQHMES